MNKERPILFSGPMVRAILDGRKTMTRRIVKPQPHAGVRQSPFVPSGLEDGHGKELRCPCGQPGDRLWVRETWAAPHAYDHLPPRMISQEARIHYTATEERGGLLWRSSIHMPRWVSRITLEITAVRVERLQDISEADALAEGIYKPLGSQFWHTNPSANILPGETPQWAYRNLWETINGPGSWDANPWVWVIEFKRIERAGKAEGRQG